MKKKTNRREELCAEYYDALITALRFRAEACGYAIGVHGSLKRDIDLIAAPWRESAISAQSLIDELKKVTLAITGSARERDVDGNPCIKPCGRRAWSIYLTYDDEGPYLDISVMPMLLPEPIVCTVS